MNRRIVRNWLVALGLSAIAMFYPPTPAAACDAACASCVAYWAAQAQQCLQHCPFQDQTCQINCQVYAAMIYTCGP
jgi:hypothetical protein